MRVVSLLLLLLLIVFVFTYLLPFTGCIQEVTSPLLSFLPPFAMILCISPDYSTKETLGHELCCLTAHHNNIPVVILFPSNKDLQLRELQINS